MGEDMLRAIAVVDIEIENGNAFQAQNIERLRGTHGDIVEDTETHGKVAFGVMARRSHGTESVLEFAFDDGTHRRRDGTGRAQGRIAGTGREHGIAIKLALPDHGNGGKNFVDISEGMDAAELFAAGFRRLAPVESGIDRIIEEAKDRHQTLHALGMPLPGIVVQASRMRIEAGRHGLAPG
jgi:hypothetical protein